MHEGVDISGRLVIRPQVWWFSWYGTNHQLMMVHQLGLLGSMAKRQEPLSILLFSELPLSFSSPNTNSVYALIMNSCQFPKDDQV